ncbi:hypothetical protein AZE42_07980 [Rhizopogon vesiculosus]|uniref:DUF6534 domain-containing protein n=1 Tax=Rhizopogon vesiculosus TaxID=180088 RepID=A0A1J8R0G4_9AGAM|nr:hypothetical protein AZE42_07980 [Rhizopogon vesiculosus]
MPPLVSRNDTLGALQVGSWVMVFLFGVETIQTYYYFKRYPNDRLWLKLLVIWIWLEEIGHTTSVLTGMYLLTVSDFGEPGALRVETMPVGFAWSILFSGTVGPIVEAFFAHRMYVLSGQPDLPIIAFCLASARFVGSTIAASKVFGGISLDDFSTQWGWLNIACLSAGAGADIIITAGQSYYLCREKSVSFGQTLKLLDRLLAYTIETGLVLSMSAVIILLLWGTNPYNFWWFGIFLFYTEVFANCLMTVLNTRKVQGDVCEVISMLSTPHITLEHSSIPGRNSSRRSHHRPLKHEMTDGMDVEPRPRVSPGSGPRSPCAYVSFPRHARGYSDITIVVPQEAKLA